QIRPDPCQGMVVYRNGAVALIRVHAPENSRDTIATVMTGTGPGTVVLAAPLASRVPKKGGPKATSATRSRIEMLIPKNHPFGTPGIVETALRYVFPGVPPSFVTRIDALPRGWSIASA